MIFLPVLIFFLGLLVGSFLSVVIIRMNTGRSVVSGRSMCMTCSRTLAWYELVPVFSFLALRGKCRTCKREISFQDPFVELITGILFVLLYSTYVIGGGFTAIAWAQFAFASIVAALAIVMGVYDLRHKIIPDSVVFPFITLSLVAVIWQAFVVQLGSFEVLLFRGVVVALPFFLLWHFSKGRAMGFGDVKLALGIGWLLGLVKGFTAIIYSFWLGAIVGIFLIAYSKRFHLKSEVPFAPFLLVGLFLVGVLQLTLETLPLVWR